ncbi:MAG: sugar phosphate isomerase/epimerase [Phycisphaerae bacterium]|nr:sugar phosphate isomerase/epimerase [Phycisphaerae bacterium]
MSHSMDRREFLRSSGGLVAGAAAGGLLGGRVAWAEQVRLSTPSMERLGWKMSVALYSYRRYPFLDAMPKIAALGVGNLEICFFLGYDKARPKLKTNEELPRDIRKELRDKVADRGMSLSSYYAGLNADADKAKRIFEFCKEMGIGVIVAEPPVAAIEMIDGLCQEYDIRLGIHNHPAKDEGYTYWRPEGVLAACKGRSKWVGACCDTGHWVRSGLDPVACLKKMEGRIVSLHLKDAAEMGNRKSKDTILGQGKGNYRALLKELKRQRYKGVMAIEYEEDTPALQDDMVKNVAFVESVAKELGG